MVVAAPKKPSLFISTAEPSGDIIAAEVLCDLKNLIPNLHVTGVAGVNLTAQGVNSLFPMSDLAVMGFTEVIPKYLTIKQRMQQAIEHILKYQPQVVITVDAYSYHIRLAKKLRQAGFAGQLIQLVAPAVWAWKPGRAKQLAKYYDRLLCILPHEPPYFEVHGLQSHYIGHPAVYRIVAKSEGFRRRLKIDENDKILVILPGSRVQEINKLLPIFLKATLQLKLQQPNLHVVIPTLPHLEQLIIETLKPYDLKSTVVTNNADKYDSFHEGDAAIATSGTIAVELAQYKLPFIIAYKTSALTYWMAKKLIKIKYACLINIMMDKPIIPELLQENCTPETIFTHINILLRNKNNQQEMQEGIRQANKMMRCPDSTLTSSQYAAQLISKLLN